MNLLRLILWKSCGILDLTMWSNIYLRGNGKVCQPLDDLLARGDGGCFAKAGTPSATVTTQRLGPEAGISTHGRKTRCLEQTGAHHLRTFHGTLRLTLRLVR